jgi:hypothetical protein
MYENGRKGIGKRFVEKIISFECVAIIGSTVV